MDLRVYEVARSAPDNLLCALGTKNTPWQVVTADGKKPELRVEFFGPYAEACACEYAEWKNSWQNMMS